MKSHNKMFLAGELVLLFVMASFLMIQVFAPSKVLATTGMIAFGGRVVTAVPPMLPACPPHTIVFDFVTDMPIGISTFPPFSNTYDYGVLELPGVAILGEHLPLPIPTCLTPYPVYQAYINIESGKNQIGTGLIPTF